VTFCVWLLSLGTAFSRSIHIVAYVGTASFSELNNIALDGFTTFFLSTCQLMDIWVISTFYLLGIVLLWPSFDVA
jgi:hypothetical protein